MNRRWAPIAIGAVGGALVAALVGAVKRWGARRMLAVAGVGAAVGAGAGAGLSIAAGRQAQTKQARLAVAIRPDVEAAARAATTAAREAATAAREAAATAREAAAGVRAMIDAAAEEVSEAVTPRFEHLGAAVRPSLQRLVQTVEHLPVASGA